MAESRASRGTRRGRRLLTDLGAELRAARVAAGLSLAEVGAAARVSSSELSRVERGLAPWLSILLAARLCSICGLDLSARAYPGGDALHDAGHVRLFDSFQPRIGAGIRRRSEVPIGDARDQRAWDQVLRDSDGSAAVEFETRLRDAQALLRRVNLKCRDSGLERVILVLADTRANREAVAAARDALRPRFPLEPSDVLAALAKGTLPVAGGVVFLRMVAARRQQRRTAGT